MRVYPAIDLKGGKCVRLVQGRMERSTVYGDPVEMALKWKKAGAGFLHMVDLDGAFDGAGRNREAVAKAVRETGLPVQLGGGIRTLEDIRECLALGVTRVILGTVLVENPELAKEAAGLYPGRIAAGIDAKAGKVATRGWATDTDLTAVDLALQMKAAGIGTVIYTDIARDGMLGGPNIPETKRLKEKTGLEIIASGGVSRLSDLTKIRTAGIDGVIVGKALYSGAFTLEDALKEE
ncbi:1-(5-phosphoribosyl)-5-[(5-phosphoribosylamino)methylideneamino]imidazole-4-carboxamide isomerase [Gehongia tenuis]|uniref:1-(5-phosphoribosyl)-5-[(5-phosphoribosylamino)methylideneamino] imidazole-4-carboxamide isomerase n=1 Tax=Gehongia tenuis TaxID=2763655 RepID=A0A926D3G9_9FIRM|nr:1-(5-phosphoribosyl)-5-[(5-phosphoribosylamino)methylideneamino]imidazole-4-carboxamide isomerase [Gehongia tenuis]MBC8530784.1 1-(5-phosphoribosyl)-5-[(5-phosphoribosylamino)methylideneamino]imidazole-4-carboxamide isomerase [Gehongia tenuis]